MPLSLVAPAFDAQIIQSGAEMSMAESNHRIANSLTLVASMLRMQALAAAGKAQAFTPEECSAVLVEAAGRVETVARLHGCLARQGVQPELADLIRDVAEATVASLTAPGQTQLTLKLAPVPGASVKIALPISLVVGELVTNSLKYAHPAGVPGRIDVGCAQSGDRALVVEVGDDGVGLPEGFDPVKPTGFGLRMVGALAAQLEAALTFEDTGVGLTVRLSLPPRVCAAPAGDA